MNLGFKIQIPADKPELCDNFSLVLNGLPKEILKFTEVVLSDITRVLSEYYIK